MHREGAYTYSLGDGLRPLEKPRRDSLERLDDDTVGQKAKLRTEGGRLSEPVWNANLSGAMMMRFAHMLFLSPLRDL